MKDKIKKLTKETTLYGAALVIGRFINFLLTPLYTNYLTKDENGFIIYIYTLIAFINIAYSFGMESSFFRFVKSDEKLDAVAYKFNEKKVFTNSYLSILFLSVINSLIIFGFSDSIAVTIPTNDATSGLIKLVALIPVLDALVLIPFAYLRSTNQALKFSMLRFLAIIVNVIANFLFLTQTNFGVWGVIYANLISSAVALIIFLPIIFKHLISKIDFSLLKQMLYFGIPTLPASFSAIILQVADRQLMPFLTTADNLAIYGINYRLGIPMMIFVSMFEYAWKPFYLNHFKDADAKVLFSKVLTYFTFASMILILVWTFSLDYIIRLPFIGGKFINPEYWIGLRIVPIVLWGYFFNGVFTNLNAGFLIQKKTKYLPLIVGIAAVSNVVINLLVIPKYTYFGAAWATFAAYLIEAVVIYYFAMKIYPIKYEWGKVFKIIIPATIILLFERAIYSYEINLTWLLFERMALMVIFAVSMYYLGIIKSIDLSFIRRLIKRK
ncbi:MAG: hypothetical protein A2X64_05800 [Ignavibacteria bacterium GWF2_33_9]|nr:MAG: hypothetical protein A2X64_05800 [Ignavibacteria bacterium GWF2_33_9]